MEAACTAPPFSVSNASLPTYLPTYYLVSISVPTFLVVIFRTLGMEPSVTFTFLHCLPIPTYNHVPLPPTFLSHPLPATPRSLHPLTRSAHAYLCYPLERTKRTGQLRLGDPGTDFRRRHAGHV